MRYHASFYARVPLRILLTISSQNRIFYRQCLLYEERKPERSNRSEEQTNCFHSSVQPLSFYMFDRKVTNVLNIRKILFYIHSCIYLCVYVHSIFVSQFYPSYPTDGVTDSQPINYIFLRLCCHLVETLRNILCADVCIRFLAYRLFDAYFVVYINR